MSADYDDLEPLEMAANRLLIDLLRIPTTGSATLQAAGPSFAPPTSSNHSDTDCRVTPSALLRDPWRARDHEQVDAGGSL